MNKNAITRLRPLTATERKVEECVELASLFNLCLDSLAREIPFLDESQYTEIALIIFQEITYFRKDFPNESHYLAAELVKSFRIAMESLKDLDLEHKVSVATKIWKTVEFID